jgi:hypothetical protein
LGGLDADLTQVAHWRLPNAPMEFPCEMVGTLARSFCQIGQSDFLSKVLVNMAPDTTDGVVCRHIAPARELDQRAMEQGGKCRLLRGRNLLQPFE